MDSGIGEGAPRMVYRRPQQETDVVERVLMKRLHPQRGVEYLVRWQGSDGSDDEWFPAIALENDYPELLDKFDAESRIVSPAKKQDDAANASPKHENAPQYSWKSTSVPPPRMTKKELKKAHKVLSKYASEKGLTKNYADVAIDYRKSVKYIVRTDEQENVVGAHPFDPPKCCMCKKRRVSLVFYPCQHACVCDSCIREHKIGVLDHRPLQPSQYQLEKTTWNACPLCVSEIKRIVRLTNTAAHDYEKWVYDVKPPIPFLDKQKFKMVGKEYLKGGTSLLSEVQRPSTDIGSEFLPTGEISDDESESDMFKKTHRLDGSESLERDMYSGVDIGCCVLS